MTRDEAIKIMDSCSSFSGAAWVARFEALGILKLDEPLESRQSPTYAAYEALFEHIPSLDFMGFRALLRAAKLEVNRSPQANVKGER
jgi:hypothetical protein